METINDLVDSIAPGCSPTWSFTQYVLNFCALLVLLDDTAA